MTGSSADDTLKGVHGRQKAQKRPNPFAIFFQGFLKHPVMVGSIIPSSQKLIHRMLSKTDWSNTKLFVEYGPGVGTFCPHVLSRMAPDATLIAIDTNPDFVAYLKNTIKDPRFIAVNGSAADVRSIIKAHGFDNADYILSGLPFSTLPEGVGATIAHETGAALRKGGAFLVYQFSPKVKNFLDPVFSDIDHEMEWINIPPAQLYWAWKQ
ncbi:MAG: methyltransferase [Zymomonas mobilis]|uniref:class I SAM-dependent methyltransferase n=1 Tax=Zymomonas mobilis TaxID=542 RepID=UPI0001B7051D|nr:hypothetical protein [Zymomonas mobilis]ACV75055.1 conserved hypothetical protein [Zymomonas mobilis subsp. mobilis NCIMB 11163]